MTTLDWVVVAVHFALLFGLAGWSFRQPRDTADDCVLAGRHLGWWIVGASIFASNIGSEPRARRRQRRGHPGGGAGGVPADTAS
jgi:hypothetical protein